MCGDVLNGTLHLVKSPEVLLCLFLLFFVVALWDLCIKSALQIKCTIIMIIIVSFMHMSGCMWAHQWLIYQSTTTNSMNRTLTLSSTYSSGVIMAGRALCVTSVWRSPAVCTEAALSPGSVCATSTGEAFCATKVRRVTWQVECFEV